MKKKNLTILSLALFATLAVNSTAMAASWVENVVVVGVEPAVGGWVWVEFNKSMSTSAGVDCDTYRALLRETRYSGHTGRVAGTQRVYRAIVDAYYSGNPIDVMIYRNDGTDDCAIDRISLGSALNRD